MNDATYRQWVRLDMYGMVVVLGLFIVFRDEFSDAPERRVSTR